MAKMGRPKKEIDLEQLKSLMRLNPTLKDTAAFFECSPDTIERLIKTEFEDITFAEFREQRLVHTRMTLVRNALKLAERGNVVMTIFCLKNLCGWKDRNEQTFSEETIQGFKSLAYDKKPVARMYEKE